MRYGYQPQATATATASAGFPMFSLLGTIFILCKVFEFGPIAAWSWWWVLSPFWIPIVLAILIAILFLIFLAIFGDK